MYFINWKSVRIADKGGHIYVDFHCTLNNNYNHKKFNSEVYENIFFKNTEI